MYLDEIKLGTTIETAPIRIDKQKMLDFAKDYDPIPLHLDEEYAKTTRYKGLIAPGVMSFMSVWAELTKQDLFGEALIAGFSAKITWHLPVYPDDILRGIGEITAITPRNPHNGIAEMTVKVYNQRHELVLTNVTESVVEYRPKQ